MIQEPDPTEVRAAREAVGHTQQHAADAVHVTRRQWQNWESGVHPISLTAWELYCIKTGQPSRLSPAVTTQ